MSDGIPASVHGINWRQFRTLVGVYLKQDLRGGRTLFQFSAGEYAGANRALFLVACFYLLLGGVTGLLALTTSMDVFLYSVFTMTVTMLIVALAVVTESASVIFDESEADILGHLPLAPRTHLVARVASLLAFVLLLAGSANLLPAIAGIWAEGSGPLFAVAHAVSATLMSIFATAALVASYGFLMRFVSRERFDSAVTYSQVALVMLFMLGYQVLPQLLESQSRINHFFSLYPPAWFAGICMLVMGRIEIGVIALSTLAIAALAGISLMGLRKVSVGHLSPVAGSRSPAGKPVSRREGRRRANRLGNAIFRLYPRRPVERAVFGLVSRYIRRDREVKLRLYPSLGYFVFFPVLALITEGLPDPFESDRLTIYPLMGAAMICLVVMTSAEALLFSTHHRAAYIVRVAPVASRGEVHAGFRKAILFWMALPGFAGLFTLYAIIWRNPLHALLVLAPWMAAIPAMMMIPFMRRDMLPLSRRYRKGQQTARNISTLATSLMCLALMMPAQLAAVRGYISYTLFLVAVCVCSPLIHFLLSALSGERQPIASESPGLTVNTLFK